nr:SDR family NAD(P)-dependent oxidoreductase [Micromonospora sp. KC723]
MVAAGRTAAFPGRDSRAHRGSRWHGRLRHRRCHRLRPAPEPRTRERHPHRRTGHRGQQRRDTPRDRTVGEVRAEDWDAVLRTNVTGVWLAMKHQIAHMKENGGGAIVNISSNLGAHLRIPNVAAYITSKAAVSALTRAAALDHIHQGIRINAVSPALPLGHVAAAR